MTLGPLLVAAACFAPAPREGRREVEPPRVDTAIAVDGRLDEPVWARAALLTGFSQYAPNDGVPASDTTEVLVWYSPTAIYFGIRAFERHGAPTATLADRDQIFADDNVQILLGPFDDGHRALMFAVNPLGVQGDGSIVEGVNTNVGGFIGAAVAGREQADRTPDYVYQSRGRVTDWGYEVEVRIPFRSLRYQSRKVQTWSLNVVRQVKHSGFEDSWAPARRASPSFVGQSGALVGLTGLHRGLVMDLNPEATSKVAGARGDAGYGYDVGRPQAGGNLRWGLSNNLTLNGTVKPDFSQVEADAGQLAFDPRQALFFPEKRPFFLEGSELFQVPNNLIYTRRIVQPVAAVKLTGHALGADFGLLSAVDRRFASATGEDHPVLNLLRAQRNLGGHSRLGVAWTDRVDGRDYNRVADVDARIVFGGIHSADLQLATSRTRTGRATTTAPLWRGQLNLRGHVWGMSAIFTGISDDFRAASGFIGRTGIAHANVDPSFTAYGRRGALVERFTGDILVDGTWQYQNFIHGRRIQDQKLHFNANAALRGGWNIGAGIFFESFGYDSALYAGYRLELPRPSGGLDTVRFVGQPTIPNLDYVVQVSTPQWRHFSASGFVALGRGDENFFEWASADLVLMNVGLVYRPSDRLRTEFTYVWQQVNRRTDGTLVNVGRIPRLKLEYQISRPLFVRLVGQYLQEKTDSLRDDSRTNAPILIVGPNGIARAAASSSNLLHADALFGLRPVPGTVIFFGYGSDLSDAGAFTLRDLRREEDSFFLKVSYLFRL